MSVLLIAMFSIPAGAIETNLTQEEAREAQIQRYAYMDLEKASSADREKILEAREEIIFRSEGWYSKEQGAISARVVDNKTGKVIKELPEFHDLFPANWDVPYSTPSSELSFTQKISESILQIAQTINTHYNANVYLYNPGTVISRSFCEFNVPSGVTSKVRAGASWLERSRTYNIGLTNATTGASITYRMGYTLADHLETTINGKVVSRVGVRASTDSTPGDSTMVVQSIFP